MAKKVEIRLDDNPTNGDSITFDITIPSKFWDTVTIYNFSSTYDVTKVFIDGTLTETVTQLYEFLSEKYSSFDWITVTEVTGDGVDIVFNVDDFTNTFNTLDGDFTIAFVTVPTTGFGFNFVLSRSPFNIQIAPTANFDSAVLNLKIYRGERIVDAPALDTYTLSKDVIIAGQSKINFEVHRLINDFVKASIPTFGTTGVTTSSINETVWVDIEIIAYYLDEEIATTTQSLYVVDGFGYHTELFNPTITTNVLSSITNHIVFRGYDYPLYFLSRDLTSISVNGTPVTFTLDDNYNNQFVSYINIGAYVGSLTSFNVVFTYTTGTETHSFTVEDTCKFPLYNCFFKNKYGFWQSIPFNMLSKTSLEIESKDYMPSIATYGQYSLASHNIETYNPQGMEKITVNTNWLPEYYNTLITEMMFSEKIYLENNGVYYPVNLDSKTWEKKTKTVDKLIQYKFDFKYSFNKMNSVT